MAAARRELRSFSTPGNPFFFHGKITADEAEKRLADALVASGAGPAFLVFELEAPTGRFTHAMRYRRSADRRGKRWLLSTPWGQTPGDGMVVLVGEREEVFRSMEHFLMMNRTRGAFCRRVCALVVCARAAWSVMEGLDQLISDTQARCRQQQNSARAAETEAARLADSVAKDVLRSFDTELTAAAARQRELEALSGEAVRALRARQADADAATATIGAVAAKLSEATGMREWLGRTSDRLAGLESNLAAIADALVAGDE
ncbi:hypothetical protein FNF27_04617 [Cafeteria roenbergensis]|uniref:Uncharacterized protein n=1 Tax=Cafeteria roenbergensis TaxID=33653 RepID=A0A5A8D7B2_CAFRO|nr:hypothetical protein FNF28_05091 [Cafeteria roenbergensis]KAA0173860.1 hypothetical protein FNF27_04617 [Cafeteria roenbergensis]